MRPVLIVETLETTVECQTLEVSVDVEGDCLAWGRAVAFRYCLVGVSVLVVHKRPPRIAVGVVVGLQIDGSVAAAAHAHHCIVVAAAS